MAVFSFWYLLLTPLLEVDKTNPAFPVAYAEFALPSAGLLWEHLNQALVKLQPLAGWLGVVLCGALLLRYQQKINTRSLLVFLLAASAFLIGISLFGLQNTRQFFVLGAMLAVLHGCFVCGLLFLLKEVIGYLGLKGAYVQTLPAVFMVVLLVIGIYPSFRDSDTIAYNFTLHDRRNDLMRYMDTSLSPGLYVSNDDNHKTFNRAWGGYNGVHDFARYPKDSLLFDKPIEEWRALGVEYAIMPQAPMLKDAGIYYPEETVRLKTYPVDPNFRDPGMTILRLYPIQHEGGGQLGSIHLVGYDLNTSELAAGEDIVFRHYWRADNPTDTVHHVGNYLLNDDDEVVAQIDYVPLWDARRDTTTWDDPDEILLGREFTLTLPSDLPPATYQLSFGLYDSATRLLSPEGSDLLDIAEITVSPPGT